MTEATEQANHRPRWRRRAAIASAVVMGLLIVGSGGAGWYFSGEVVDVTHDDPQFPLTVGSVDTDRVGLPRTDETARDGVWGLHWATGRAVLGAVVDGDADTVVRHVDRVLYGTLAAGTKARIDTWTYGDDPGQAYGMDFDTVDIPTELGPAPAWFLPADGDTWVVAVHGRNASPGEALRIIPTLHDSGVPVLSVTHRNDRGAPAGPDGLHHLGATEWRDVAAAVDWATEHGAAKVVLYGWSMGGAVVMMTLRNMADPDRVAGVVLDSPVLDWESTLDKQGAQRSVPAPIVALAEQIVEWRVDLDLDDLDQRDHAAEVMVPVLLFVDTADETVDVSASLDFAERVDPGLITLVTTAAGHTASWNAGPDAYCAAVEDFLTASI